MKVILKLLILLGLSTALHAQADLTFVSGVGDDANPCSRTAPCRTFAGAIAKTASGGEIDALDPGGFGALTITKAITIDGGSGQVASVLVAGTNGIVVAAGSSDVVRLRNLSFNGVGLGLTGVEFLSGLDLEIENCSIADFTQNGIDISPTASVTVHVIHTSIKNIGQVGIHAVNSSGTTQLDISDSKVVTTNTGIQAADHSSVVINHSVIDSASAAGLQAETTSGSTVVFVSDSDLSLNGTGIQSGPGKAQVTVSHSRLAFNGTQLVRAGGAIFVNQIDAPHGEGEQ